MCQVKVGLLRSELWLNLQILLRPTSIIRGADCKAAFGERRKLANSRLRECKSSQDGIPY
jgi:hypothetical protein